MAIFDPTGKEKQLMTDSRIVYRTLHGGNSTLTLVSPRTFKCHVYKFQKPKNERDFPEDTIFVYVVHEGRKMYLGMLSGSDFRRTQRSTFAEETEAMKGARYIVKMAMRQDVIDSKKMLLYHSGRCCCCGRKLEGDKALADAMGKKCLARYKLKLGNVPWDGN